MNWQERIRQKAEEAKHQERRTQADEFYEMFAILEGELDVQNLLGEFYDNVWGGRGGSKIRNRAESLWSVNNSNFGIDLRDEDPRFCLCAALQLYTPFFDAEKEFLTVRQPEWDPLRPRGYVYSNVETGRYVIALMRVSITVGLARFSDRVWARRAGADGAEVEAGDYLYTRAGISSTEESVLGYDMWMFGLDDGESYYDNDNKIYRWRVKPGRSIKLGKPEDAKEFIQERLLEYVMPDYLPSALEEKGRKRIETLVHHKF